MSKRNWPRCLSQVYMEILMKCSSRYAKSLSKGGIMPFFIECLLDGRWTPPSQVSGETRPNSTWTWATQTLAQKFRVRVHQHYIPWPLPLSCFTERTLLCPYPHRFSGGSCPENFIFFLPTSALPTFRKFSPFWGRQDSLKRTHTGPQASLFELLLCLPPGKWGRGIW